MSIDYKKFCHKLKITRRIQETDDTVSLVLEIPDALKDRFKYKAGQFVTFFMEIAGETVSRSYSLASSPDAGSDFKVSVKLVPGGKGSTYLIQTAKVGDELWTAPPAGLFCLPEKYQDKKVVLFAGGSGITPAISLIKSVLHKSTTDCALYFQNRDENSIIFREELTALEQKFSKRFSVTHILSKPATSWAGQSGRATNESIHDFLKHSLISPKSLFYVCGPEGFMKTVAAALKDVSVEKSAIHTENFGTVSSHTTTATQATLSDDKLPAAGGSETWIGDPGTRSNPVEIEVLLDGEAHTVKYKGKASVLETLLEAGLNPPYSCMDGACMACMAKVQGGLVYQKDPGILSDENIEAGECLTCQARPASGKVKINYSVF